MKHLVCLFVSALLGCEVASHVASDTQPGGSEAVQNQGSVDETSADQNGPVPVPKKPGPGVPMPKPTPPPAQPDAGAGSDDASGTSEADTSATDEGATDEEEFEGCGPMDGPYLCEANADCPWADVPWTTNTCIQGQCLGGTPSISFGYTGAVSDPAGACIVISQLGPNGFWVTTSNPVPHEVQLEDLCVSLEKSAYIDPSIAPEIVAKVRRVMFTYTTCSPKKTGINLDMELPWIGMDIKFLPKTEYTFVDVFQADDPVSNAEWGYIESLGSFCNKYNHPESSSLYILD